VILYPAIDIRGGRAVRLQRGDYARETVYDADPLGAARRWLAEGARALHVVDLDGARAGKPANLGQVRLIAAEANVPLQLGGGLRDAGSVAAALEAGADRVVLGTAALAEPGLVAAIAEEHGERVVVGLDARRGRLAVEGWERETAATPTGTVADLAARGVRTFVFTPVEVDGTLGGPALEELQDVARAAARAGATLIYSGGIGTLDDLRALRELSLENLAGVIVGRALYERRFTVAEGQAALDG
jgi:phosphoribosylformimino-5-aminoimidazole carboxamide ribotide isomerase